MSGDEDSLRLSPEGPGVDCDQGREEVRLWVEAISSGGDIAALITQEQAQQSRRQDIGHGLSDIIHLLRSNPSHSLMTTTY